MPLHAIDRDLRDALQAQNDISGQAATTRRSINDMCFNALLPVLSTQAVQSVQAMAAKDSAARIEASMHGVAQGRQWVRDAGDHMAAIVDAMNRVSPATQESPHATRAQNTDLTRIVATFRLQGAVPEPAVVTDRQP